ncbi:MAG: hypothetical protein AUG49_00265, partial [Catenulispora sp. 13_1_20CM_3_70_7]
MDDERQGRAAVLIGREKDLEILHSLIERTEGTGPQGPVLMLRGDAGVGKTALLKATADRAAEAGFRVLWVSGAEDEVDLEFAALQQLSWFLRDRLDGLDAYERDVLGRALGRIERAGQFAPARLAVSAAALSLVDAAVESAPLLLVIDDAQWIDPASAEVFGFVARRVAPERGRVLIAGRGEPGSALDRARFPEWEVEPLSEPAAEELLALRHPDLAPAVRRAVAADAAGCPLALIDLPAALSPGQRRGHEALPSTPALNRRLRQLYAEDVAGLAPHVADVLLLAALEQCGDLGVIEAAAGDRWEGGTALAAAEVANLIRVQGRRVVFRHPLIRSSVVQRATPLARRAAHRALAEHLSEQPDRQVWHRADARAEPDEQVALALETAARRAATGDDAAGALAALVRAAELSPGPDDRARRLTEAAYIAGHVARFDEAERLLEEAQRSTGAPGVAAQSARTATAYLQLHHEGDIDAAHRLALQALRDGFRGGARGGAGIAGVDLSETLYTMFSICFCAGRRELWDEFDAILLPIASRMSEDLLLIRDAFHSWEEEPDVRERLTRRIESLSGTDEVRLVPRLGLAAAQIDALDVCRPRLRRMLDHERTGSAVVSRLSALTLLAVDARLSGRWDDGDDLARRAAEMPDAAGYPLFGHYLRCQSMLIAAGRGDHETVDRLAKEITAWAAPRRIGLCTGAVFQARALLALGEGDYEQAYSLGVQAVGPSGPDHRVHDAAGMVMDLVEAAVRTGRTRQARAHAEAARRIGSPAISSRLSLLFHACEALVAVAEDRPADDVEASFSAAATVADAHRWPLDLARVQLCFGEWLRRARTPVSARPQLSAALAAFETLGAESWAARARNELRASGVAVNRPQDP